MSPCGGFNATRKGCATVFPFLGSPADLMQAIEHVYQEQRDEPSAIMPETGKPIQEKGPERVAGGAPLTFA